MANRDTIQQRTREAAHLQMIEGNPLDADDIAMFEMFDREGLSVDQQLAYVHEELSKRDQERKYSSAPVFGPR